MEASLTKPSFGRSLSQDHPSCSSIASHDLLWRRTPSTAPFNGALHSWSLDPCPPKSPWLLASLSSLCLVGAAHEPRVGTPHGSVLWVQPTSLTGGYSPRLRLVGTAPTAPSGSCVVAPRRAQRDTPHTSTWRGLPPGPFEDRAHQLLEKNTLQQYAVQGN